MYLDCVDSSDCSASGISFEDSVDVPLAPELGMLAVMWVVLGMATNVPVVCSFESRGGLVDSVGSNNIITEGGKLPSLVGTKALDVLFHGWASYPGTCEYVTGVTSNGTVSEGSIWLPGGIPSAPSDHTCGLACSVVST